jgi:hypothetical protein
MDCSKLKSCPFFNDKMPMEGGIGSIYKKKYCTGGNDFCARHIVMQKLGPEFVPNNLYPNMLDLANQIIETGQSTHGNDPCT